MSALFPTETNVDSPKPELGGLAHDRDPERAALREERRRVPQAATSSRRCRSVARRDRCSPPPCSSGRSAASRMRGTPRGARAAARRPPRRSPRTRRRSRRARAPPSRRTRARPRCTCVGGDRDERHLDVHRARRARWRTRRSPCTTAALGLTACTTPANGGASRLWRSRPPIDRVSREAPITATDAGRTIARTAFAAATRSRLSYAWSASSVSAVGNSTSTAPGVTRGAAPGSRCDGRRRSCGGSRAARARGTSRWPPRLPLRQVRDQDRAETVALEFVGDAHAHLGARGVPFSDVLRAADHVAAFARSDGQQREVVR